MKNYEVITSYRAWKMFLEIFKIMYSDFSLFTISWYVNSNVMYFICKQKRIYYIGTRSRTIQGRRLGCAIVQVKILLIFFDEFYIKNICNSRLSYQKILKICMEPSNMMFYLGLKFQNFWRNSEIWWKITIWPVLCY